MLNTAREELLIRSRPANNAGGAPVLEPSARKAGLATSILVVLNILSLASAIGMIVVLFFISQSVREVASLEHRLSDLTQFEGRLSNQIDTVNQGIHSQFDEMNRRVSAMADQISRLQKDLETVSAHYRDNATRDQTLDAVPQGDEGTSVELEDAEIVLSAPPPEIQGQPATQTPQPRAREVRFERIESSDGKVTYSKRR